MTATKADLVGKAVYNPDAGLVGEVVDLGFQLGQGAPILILKANGSTYELPWERIGAAKEILLAKEAIDLSSLKVVQQAPQALPQQGGAVASVREDRYCTSCGKKASWIQEYQRFYCYKCKRYV